MIITWIGKSLVWLSFVGLCLEQIEQRDWVIVYLCGLFVTQGVN